MKAIRLRARFVTSITLLVGLIWSLSVVSVSAASVTVRAPTLEGTSGKEIEIPIDVAGAAGVGALRVELTYDPAILEPVAVEQGDLAKNARVDFNQLEPGRIIMGFVTLENVEGDGTVMVARFRVSGQQDQSTALGLE